MSEGESSTFSIPLFSKWLTEFGGCFALTSSGIFCTTCEVHIICQKKSQLSQHTKTKMHLKSSHANITDETEKIPDKIFYMDLSEAFIAANIPVFKLKNPVLRNFIEKYTKRHIPDESTIRKNYIPGCYNKVMTSLKQKVSNNYTVAATAGRTGGRRPPQ